MVDIKGFEGLYAITSCGKVWSYKRKQFNAPRYDKDGYLRVNLFKDGKQYTRFIHQLVAQAYISNPEGKATVNHKDEVKTHNWVGNLEWMTIKENVNYGTGRKRAAVKRSKAVRCVETGEVFANANEAAAAFNCASAGIAKCCRGKQLTCLGKHFEYVKESK